MENPPENTIRTTTLEAGDFDTWLAGTKASQLNGKEADVPCGSCNACCKSFYFIHITASDVGALKVIPKELLVQAPGLPSGHFVMGYTEQGHCPMLVNERCSIYNDRPQTCRAYDCRIFAAAEMQPGEMDKVLVSRQTSTWAFSYANPAARATQAAIARAANWLASERENNNSYLPNDFLPSNSTQLAVLALQLRELFGPEVNGAELSSPEHAEACVNLIAT